MRPQASDDVSSSDPDAAPSASSSAKQQPSGTTGGAPGKPALRKYIESFDQAMMVQTASFVSKEGLNLLERQTSALWGDAKELQKQMQEVRGGRRWGLSAHQQPPHLALARR